MWWKRMAGAGLALACVALAPTMARGDASSAEAEAAAAGGGICARTSDAALRACRTQAGSDRSLAVGTCINLGDAARRDHCLGAADQAFSEVLYLCQQQYGGRQQLCRALGEAAYDPPVKPDEFTTRIDNAYLPLTPGTVFRYRSPHGRVVVEVTRRTRKIAGVTCVVVHDAGFADGRIEEDTFDYYAQDRAGNVWYFGEDTAEYAHGVVVSVEGAWLTGVDGAKPGIVMPAAPKVGTTYRQEFLLGTAEDAAEVRSLSAPVRVPFGAFGKSLRTREFSPLEPGTIEDKYYVKGVGQVLTVDLSNGEREVLVEIDHH